MSHYRKIDVRIWNDGKFNSLSSDGKLAFFMLLTHPMMTALGAMRGTPEGLASEIGMDPEPFKEGFRELLSKGMAEHDPNGRLIALPNFLKYNPPANPNAVRSWVKSLEFLPECELRSLVVQRARASTKGFKEPLPEPFSEPESREQRTESREQRLQQSNHREGTSQGKRLREYVDADGVVHEVDSSAWGGQE
ncbi:hypothetical protein [Nitratireductor thuwali]|uniref:Uncharacterized protein n=1 Tax=Nitratireductor thuwali TaxID=2267699 RepID=A0ABY5MNJ4_9HYPH|nr:hypothetical protein NTH_04033 [Nitratireductor thuwali]